MLRSIWSLAFCAVLLAAVTLLCFFGQHLSFGDRLSHFPIYWAAAALGIVICALLKRRWRVLLIGAVLFCVHAVPVALLWIPDRRVSSQDKPASLTVVSSNVYLDNRRKSEALAKLLELSPDLLVLMETNEKWEPILKAVVEKYPHTLCTNDGIWLLSRYPLRLAQRTEMKVADAAEANVMVEATILVSGTAIRVVAIHPPPPRGSARIRQQRNQGADYVLALRRDKDARHQMLIGDFNTSPFSAVFSHIAKTTGLSNASKGYGYHPTWGPRLPREPILPWIGTSIDHALVSDQVLVEDWKVGEMPGADHRYQALTLRF